MPGPHLHPPHCWPSGGGIVSEVFPFCFESVWSEVYNSLSASFSAPKVLQSTYEGELCVKIFFPLKFLFNKFIDGSTRYLLSVPFKYSASLPKICPEVKIQFGETKHAAWEMLENGHCTSLLTQAY